MSQGNIVTIDAMGCQSSIAQKIIAQKADYIMAIKSNQKKRYKAVETYCHTMCLKSPGTRTPDYDAFDETHGRLVRRRGWVLAVPEELTILHDWPGITNIILIESIRSINHTGKISCTLRYYLSSCRDSPVVQITAVRKHWTIENGLHWVLDVTFREDDARTQDKIAARIFSLLRKMALNIVRQDFVNNTSLRGRRKRAGWDDSYMAHLLFNGRESTAHDFDA